jgi:hypothetical protein
MAAPSNPGVSPDWRESASLWEDAVDPGAPQVMTELRDHGEFSIVDIIGFGRDAMGVDLFTVVWADTWMAPESANHALILHRCPLLISHPKHE